MSRQDIYKQLAEGTMRSEEAVEEMKNLEEGLFDGIKKAFLKGIIGELEKTIDSPWHGFYGINKITSIADAKKILQKAKKDGHIVS